MKIRIPFNKTIQTPNGIGVAKELYIDNDGKEYRLVCHSRKDFQNSGVGKPFAPHSLDGKGPMVLWLYERKEIEK